MKNVKRVFSVVFLLSLFWFVLPMTASASMVAEKNSDGMYLFWDIPFDATTPEDVQDMVQKRTGTQMTISSVEDQQIVASQDHEMDLFGYPATLAATFGENEKLQYIKLYSRFAAILPEYENGITDHGALGLKVYQRMWEQAVQQYGEPDKDYFILGGDGIGLWKQGEAWDSPEMVNIFETEKSNVALLTHWGNVRLFCLMYFNQQVYFKREPAFVEFCYANREWPVPKTIKEHVLPSR